VQEIVLAELGLGGRREHARGDLPRGGLSGLEHDDARAALLGAPGAGQPDRAATHDGDVEAL
jgi:hypothetical protein